MTQANYEGQNKMELSRIASFESRGSATFITCNHCGASLAANKDWTAGSGHKADCNAILAGLTFDPKRNQHRDRCVDLARMGEQELDRALLMYEYQAVWVGRFFEDFIFFKGSK